jgi:SAM-dependent methyltransferase
VPHEHTTGNIHYTQEFWDDRYRTAGQLWSGRPNANLVTQAEGLTPGAALDAGCGEGADSIWLASQGWTVTAVDVSAVALERGAAAAKAAGDGIADRIHWQREDLLTWAPEPGSYDLVSAQFMHMAPEAFAEMHLRLATGLRPGGSLLVVTHHPDDEHMKHRHEDHPGLVPSPEDLVAMLGQAQWEIAFSGAVTRDGRGPDGQPARLTDSVLRAVRRG